jgi:exonuclease III
VQKPDVLFLQETWVASDDMQLSIYDYVAFHAEAQLSHGHAVGGLSSYFKISSFAAGRLVKIPSPVWWTLTTRWVREDSQSFIFINVYAALHTQGVLPTDLDLFFEFVDELRYSNAGDEMIIAGDLNADRFRRPNADRRLEKKILEWIRRQEANDFRVIPDRAVVTFVDASTTLDYVMLSPTLSSSLVKWEVEEALNCQHLPLVVRLNIDQRETTTSDLLVPRQPNLRFSPAAVTATRLLLHELSVDLILPTVDLLYASIVQAFTVHGVEKRAAVVDQGQTWWKYVPVELQNRLRELEQDAQFLASQWSAGRLLFSVHDVVALRRELNGLSKACYHAAEVALLQELRTQFPSQGLCWKVLKKMRSPCPTVAIDVGTLQRHFSTIFHRRDRPLFLAPDINDGWGETADGDQDFDESFSDKELEQALRELNGQAGTGPERIPAQSIKDVFVDEKSRSVLLALMNACFQDGVVPVPWGLAELFILHKGKGLPTLADSYRAIALSDDFRRVYERLVQQRLGRWSARNNAKGRMQFGFRAGTGTMDAIFVLRSFMLYVTRVLCVPGFALYIDLRKAFPSLSRPKTIQTFREKKVPMKIIRAVGSLMSGTSQRLRVNGKLTQSFFVTSGTPEGSINSPEIFAMVYKVLLEALDIHELPDDPTQIDPKKVYYIIFADDLTFLGLDLALVGKRAEEFKRRCVIFDMLMNAGKTKWQAFLPVGEPSTTPNVDWKLVIDGDEIENVDEFLYLGYVLDCRLTDEPHARMINERYLKAARATGKLMRDLKCSNLLSLRKFFISMVFSQLYGLVFVDVGKVDFERGVGIFLKTSLGLPDSFPHVVALALLHVKHARLFQTEQILKLLLRWESRTESPAFDAMLIDRISLFPVKVGLNARLGDILASLDLSRTLDYKQFYQFIVSRQAAKLAQEHVAGLLEAEGRAFWTEVGADGHLPYEFTQVFSLLNHEAARIVVLMLADMLCWSAMKSPTRSCPHCDGKFTTAHFFSCSKFFIQDEGWRTLVGLWAAGSWEDALDFTFHVFQKWATDTTLCRADFRLAVLSYSNLCTDVTHTAFRWNL